jgi:catalase
MTSNPKIWFITGISRGFGRELASAALEQSDVVIGTSRNGKSDIGAVPDRFHVFALDVTNHRDVVSVVTQAWQISRRIDVVVNNAGFGVLGAVEEVEEQQARNVFETNFFGLLSVTQAALPHLRTQATGHIINISSVGGFVGSPGYGLYNASKFAVEGLSEALASELKPLGIHVTIVEPGYFRTNFLSGSSLQRAGRVIEEYAATSGKTRESADERDGQQPGDPTLAAKAIIAVTRAQNPPLRLILGEDALERVRAKLTQVTEDLETWKSTSVNTAYPEVAVTGEATKFQTPLAELPRASLIIRFAAIGAVLAGIVGLFAFAGGWLTPHALTPASMTNRFEQVNGLHPGFRRNHAKGVCVSGYFDSDGRGVSLSKATVFLPGRVPIIGRFSMAGGQPYIADAPHTIRGMAILFELPNGEEWRTAMINIPVFTASTPQAFYDQLLAFASDPATGKSDPARMSAFFAKYPESAKAMQLIRAHPVSSGFENGTYNSLNAFRFINAKGTAVPVRWSMVPAQPFEPVSTASPDQVDKNYLFDALIASIHKHALQWHLIITIGQPGDPTSDATLPWPPDRQQIDAGTLTIDHVESDDTSPARDINFDPLVLPNGVATSDDPLLSTRSAVYSQSFTRREGEPKEPSAISAAETRK